MAGTEGDRREPDRDPRLFGIGFLHPHLRGATLGDWPLNVSNEERAAAELPTLRAIASADIHNLVFQTGGDYRIIPAVLSGRERG